MGSIYFPPPDSFKLTPEQLSDIINTTVNQMEAGLSISGVIEDDSLEANKEDDFEELSIEFNKGLKGIL